MSHELPDHRNQPEQLSKAFAERRAALTQAREIAERMQAELEQMITGLDTPRKWSRES